MLFIQHSGLLIFRHEGSVATCWRESTLLFFSSGRKSAFPVIVSERRDAGLNAYDKTHRARIDRTQTARQLGLRSVCACWTAHAHAYKHTELACSLSSNDHPPSSSRFNTNAFMATYVGTATMELAVGYLHGHNGTRGNQRSALLRKNPRPCIVESLITFAPTVRI